MTRRNHVTSLQQGILKCFLIIKKFFKKIKNLLMSQDTKDFIATLKNSLSA
jgi:spore maturation protein CgeB